MDLLVNTHVVSEEQSKRINKAINEPIFLLDVNELSGGIEFMICGNTRHVYTVNVVSGASVPCFTCNCPDWLIHCRRHKCLCKHVSFVLLKVFRQVDCNIFINPDYDTIKLIYDAQKRSNVRIGANVICSELSHAYYNKLDETVRAKTFEVSTEYSGIEDCPICFNIMDAVQTCKQCPTCRKLIHTACIERWLSYGTSTCVYCRSPSWVNYSIPYVKGGWDFIKL